MKRSGTVVLEGMGCHNCPRWLWWSRDRREDHHAVRYAREKSGPVPGYMPGDARSSDRTGQKHGPGFENANSSEFDKETPHPVIALITEWMDNSGEVETRSEESDMGGTMRLGGQECFLVENTLAHHLYNKDFNN